VAALLWFSLPIRAQERTQAAEPATFMAQLDVDGEREPLPATQGTTGPLFLLEPIVARLGSRLDVVPLEQSHRLRIGDTDVVLGPGTIAMTVGRSIVTLRQAPFISGAGLWVPFEALEQSFGELLGMDLRWFPDERLLEVRSRHAREVAVDVQVVHIQGVTTVVLQFDRAAKYQVATRGSVVEVTVPTDRVHLLRDPQPPRQSLLDRVETSEHRIRLQLVSGAVAADPYVLPAAAGQSASGGLRLVIDISSSAAPPLAVDGAPTLPDIDPNFDAPGLRTIVLDPGHGGVEHGAIGPAGTQEKELTLILAKALKRKLEERLAVQVVLTRNEDADLPLDTRTALANQTKGDLFISIHLNAAPESSAHGAETYFLAPKATDARAQAIAESENRAGTTEASADPVAGDAGLQLLLWDLAQSQHLAASQSLARIVQQELNTTLGLTDRGVRQAPFAVLVGATMPAVLVELGFITNPKEEERLLDPDYRSDLLDAVVRAVVRFKAMVDGATASAAVVPQ
jgi:N-acetylmuramoyl-L-alanine amidase